MRTYVSHLREKSGDGFRAGCGRAIPPADRQRPAGQTRLAETHARHLAEWKARTLAKGGSRLHYNRNATVLRAALNLALSRRSVASDMAWATELKPLKLGDGEGRRKLKLDRDDVGKLIAHASDEFRPLLVSLALLPLRPGEIAKAKVQDFNAREGTLFVVGKKRSRTVPLSTQAIAHFRECAKNKLPQRLACLRADGGQWNHSTWRRELRPAARAGLPAATCLYLLRHSAITALLVGGLDVLTVSRVSGTSIQMIQPITAIWSPPARRKPSACLRCRCSECACRGRRKATRRGARGRLRTLGRSGSSATFSRIRTCSHSRSRVTLI